MSEPIEINAAELKAKLDKGSVLLVDVREPAEFAAGHIPGAINQPFSDFDPAGLDVPPGKTVVLQCAGGKRSAMALEKCASTRAAIDTHLAGGIGAWVAAGLAVVKPSDRG